MKPRSSDCRLKKKSSHKHKNPSPSSLQWDLQGGTDNHQRKSYMQELNHQILDCRQNETRAEIQRKRRVLNHKVGLDVSQGVDLNTTEMDQMPSTSGINTNINRASQVMDNAKTSAMHASTSEHRQTPVSYTGASEINTLRQPVPSEHNGAEAIHCSSIMQCGDVSSFGATGPGPSQIPENDAQRT